MTAKKASAPKTKSVLATDDKMTNAVKVFLATAVIALPLGFVVGNTTASNQDDDDKISQQDMDDHGDSDSHSAHMQHELFEVESAASPQILDLSVVKDAKSGWNVSFMTNNFTFAPQSASSAHVDGEGHAHLYVDGEKLTRMYSGDYYVGDLSEGQHTIKVTLNTNDHKDYAVNGQVIEASVVVTDMHHADDESDAGEHSHDN